MLVYSLPVNFETLRVAIESRDELPKMDILRIKIIVEWQCRADQSLSKEDGAYTAKFGNEFQNQRFKAKKKLLMREKGILQSRIEPSNEKLVKLDDKSKEKVQEYGKTNFPVNVEWTTLIGAL
ncbi:hypothetical protein AVEN_130025-1 [Araneus ventricosus]|uniref:Uncharacterized protein n=1 Tax=Araneus ventricosus TaxID=182803 RepID=A0A4Y2Q2W6_ARAVE|nr:hypothetical protein AVEN_130025-1 [Araneus ventricosus]